MQLTNFFAPLNLQNIFIFIFTLVVFDAAGASIAYFLKPPEFLRPTYWIWGLGIYVFVWFILHFFIPFWPVYVWSSLIITGGLSLPIYIKQKGPLALFRQSITFPYPFLFLLLVAKPLFFLLSAPPYVWDEMAYHFYSPARLMTEMVWPFIAAQGQYGPTLYDMLPRFLDTSYILMFSLSKTYALARLLHFFILISGVFSIALFIRKNISVLSAIIYTFLALFFTPSVLQYSTSGFTDVGAAILTSLFFIIFVDLLIGKKANDIYIIALIFGLTIGTKYTILSFLGVTVLIGVLFLLITHFKQYLKKTRKLKIGKKVIAGLILVTAIILVFGGYWYVRNFLFTGNPLYPMLFPCRNDPTCGVNQKNFFTGWTIPFQLARADEIIKIIFYEKTIFYFTVASLLVSFIISFLTKKSILRIMSFLIIVSVFLEILLSRKFVGFEPRYFYHWSLLIPLSLSLPFSVVDVRKVNSSISFYIFLIYGFMAFYLLHNVLFDNIRTFNSDDFVPGYVRNYAMRRTTLSQWMDFYFPQMNEVIKWCGEKRQVKEDILAGDPALIWYSYEGLMRVFIVNCNILWQSPPGNMSITQYAGFLRNKYPQAHITSSTKCDKGEALPANSDETVRKHYQLNQELICTRHEVIKNLYSF